MKRASITEDLVYGTALDRLTGSTNPLPPPEPTRRTAGQETVGQPGNARIKLSVFLNGDEDAYLESLASTAKFSGGKKLSKTRIIEALVLAFRKTKLDVRGVKTDDELLKRVIAQLR